MLGKCFWLGGREGCVVSLERHTRRRSQLTDLARPLRSTSLFINLALTVTATFLVLFAPFLSSLSTFLQALHRIFPFARGLFEDKVANVWCALNVVVKLRDLVPVSTLAKLALVATATALVPSVGAVLYVSYRLGRERALSPSLSPSPGPRAAAPTVILLPHALFLSAMAFFLLSFQVHEKSILLPLMPLTLLMGAREVGYGRMDWEWGVLVNNVAVFRCVPRLPSRRAGLTNGTENPRSMWPLLQRDGVATQYAALTLLWNYALGYNPLTLRPSFVKYLSLVRPPLPLTSLPPSLPIPADTRSGPPGHPGHLPRRRRSPRPRGARPAPSAPPRPVPRAQPVRVRGRVWPRVAVGGQEARAGGVGSGRGAAGLGDVGGGAGGGGGRGGRE